MWQDGVETKSSITPEKFREHYHERSSATMSVQRHIGSPKTRRVNLLADNSNGINFGVHNSSINNLERALYERVFFVSDGGEFKPPPKPKSAQMFVERLSRFKQSFRKLIPPTTAWSFNDFVNSYTGRKRGVYERAVSSLATKPLDIRDSYIQAFVKAEKINFSAKKDPAPRVIQPRSPRYNA